MLSDKHERDSASLAANESGRHPAGGDPASLAASLSASLGGDPASLAAAAASWSDANSRKSFQKHEKIN